MINLQAFRAKIHSCLYFNRNDPCAGIYDEVDLTGTAVIGVIIDVQIFHGFELLTNILLSKRTLKLHKQIIAIQQCMLPKAGHTAKETNIEHK